MEKRNLSSQSALLSEIKKLSESRNSLMAIRSHVNFKNVRIFFNATDPVANFERMICISDLSVPFLLSNEVKNLIEDAIEDYTRDIATLNLHLKNL